MTVDAVGVSVVAAAAALGVTHALEPDHVSGISAVATEAADSRIATLAGGAFGVGHAVLVCVWVALWWVFDGLGAVPAWVSDAGAFLIAVVLATLGVVLGHGAVRRLIHRHDHVHDDETHAHYHVHLPFVPHGQATHGHDHSAAGYLKMGVLGALFALSPPLSMIAFLAMVVSTTDSTVVVVAVGAYSATIVAAMGTIGASAGRVAGVLDRYGDGVQAALQLLTAVVLLAAATYVGLPLV